MPKLIFMICAIIRDRENAGEDEGSRSTFHIGESCNTFVSSDRHRHVRQERSADLERTQGAKEVSCGQLNSGMIRCFSHRKPYHFPPWKKEYKYSNELSIK